jgi:hypothetical protein
MASVSSIADGALKAAEIAMKGRKNFRNWLF